MPSPRFVHLRFHSEYSITDGIVRIDPMIHAVLEGGGAAVGISDLMNVFWRPALLYACAGGRAETHSWV